MSCHPATFFFSTFLLAFFFDFLVGGGGGEAEKTSSSSSEAAERRRPRSKRAWSASGDQTKLMDLTLCQVGSPAVLLLVIRATRLSPATLLRLGVADGLALATTR